MKKVNREQSEIKIHDLVKTIYGEIHEVIEVDSSAIYFYGGTWCHPTKCWKVNKKEVNKQFFNRMFKELSFKPSGDYYGI